MRVSSKLKIATVLLAGASAMAASPAMAGRCGSWVTVTTQSSLAQVARQCNVDLDELYDANTSVNPRALREGQRLAIPDELEPGVEYADGGVITGGGGNSDSNTSDYVPMPITDDYGLIDDADASPYRRSAEIIRHRIRMRDAQQAQRSNDIIYRDRTDVAPRSYGSGNVAPAPSIQDRAREQDYLRGLNRGLRQDDAVRHVEWRLDESANSGQTQVWVRDQQYVAPHFDSERMSYQEKSRLRLAAANNYMVRTNPNYVNAPTTTLVDCPVVRDANGRKLHHVNRVIEENGRTYIEVSTGRNGATECTVHDASATTLGSSGYMHGEPGVPLAKFTNNSVTTVGRSSYATSVSAGQQRDLLANASHFSLQGDVVGVENGCLIMRTANNDLWRLAAAPPSGELLGKTVTVWGASAAPGTCSGQAMIVNHAVYAEPVFSR